MLPEGIPPVTGTAVAQIAEGDESESGWTIALTLPRDTWRAIQVAMPKLEWPEPKWEKVRPGFREGTMTLVGDSMPTRFRVVDISGKELAGDQVLQQLNSKTPVLIAASGRMPPACYLGLPTHAKLIVLLGPGDKQEEVAEGKKPKDTKAIPADNAKEPHAIDLKQWSEEKSQQYFFELMQKSKEFKIKTQEEASNYLQGIWRLDKRAHVGGGHYVRADLGADVAVVCTDKWLVVRLMNAKETNDTVSRFERIERDEKGHLHLKEEVGSAFDHFLPLDDDHMAVLAYDFIAVVQRIPCETAEPAAEGAEGPSNSADEKKAAKQTDNEAIEAAKAHLRARLTSDRKMLSKSYAAKVRLLRKGDLLDREKVIDAALKQFAGGGDVPDEAIRQFLDRLDFESLQITEGEFVTEPSAAIATKDGRLHFQIEKGDAVVKIIQEPSAWFLQFRKANGEWTVVAEYTD